MRRGNLIFFAHLLAVFCTVMAVPAGSKPKPDWTTYRLNVADVRACAFTPDGDGIAFVYLTNHLLSEKPWEAVYTSHLAVWDFGTGKIEEKLRWDYRDQGRDPWPVDPRYMEFRAEGRRLTFFDSSGIREFEIPSYRLESQTSFNRPTAETSLRGMTWNIVGFSAARDGSRVAVALSDPGIVDGGIVRVYELPSGKIIQEWKLGGEVRGIAGINLSPDGNQVAVSWLPSEPSSDPEAFIPSGTNNVRVMDVKTGTALIGVHTRYFAGPVLFGPDDTLLTGSINDDRKGYSLDTIKIWDAKSGKLLREITNPRTGVHYRLDLSPDGKLLLGYTGTEKPVENFVTVDSQQFQIWDFASGKVIAASPKILPIENGPPQLQLSPDGRFVVVWWGDGFAKPVVYEIPRH